MVLKRKMGPSDNLQKGQTSRFQRLQLIPVLDSQTGQSKALPLSKKQPHARISLVQGQLDAPMNSLNIGQLHLLQIEVSEEHQYRDLPLVNQHNLEPETHLLEGFMTTKLREAIM